MLGLHHPDPQPDRALSEARTEAAHLRRLIELQPSCLMRADTEGRLLAANRAALGFLGASTPIEVLNRSLLEYIAPAHHSRWRDFAERLSTGAPASVECEVPDALGADRTMLLQGIPLLDHQDGVPSFMLAAHDVSAIRRLERDLEAGPIELALPIPGEDDGRIRALQEELDAARAEVQRLSALTESTAAPSLEPTAFHDLRSSLEEAHQLALLERDRLARRQIDQAEHALAQSLEERQRLRVRLQEVEQHLADRRDELHELVAASEALETTAAAVRPGIDALDATALRVRSLARRIASPASGSPGDDEPSR